MSSEEEPVAWLRAAILERKAMALAAGDDDAARAWTGSDHGYEDGGEVHDGHDEQVVYDEGSPNTAQALHIALNDPQDTIARCEAELAILDEHYILYRGDTNELYEEFSVCYPPGIPGLNCGCVTCHYIGHGGVNEYGICRTVKFLASGYQHPPGYREEDWKPGVRPWKAPSGHPR